MKPAATLRSPAEIRSRSHHLLARARDGASAWFTVQDDAMDSAAAAVADLTVARFPDLDIPFHSRWRHFEAGGVDRKRELDGLLAGLDPAGCARAMIDLTVVSVLLDAGAGPDWTYREADTGLQFSRSEGLGVASWHAFTAGVFSSDPACPLQADAAGLIGLDTGLLAGHLQLGPDNPLVGFDGRADLLRRLGAALAAQPAVFGVPGRPGDCSICWPPSRPPTTCWASCCRRCREYGPPVTPSTASRWATAGRTPPCPVPGAHRAGCRSTNCPSG